MDYDNLVELACDRLEMLTDQAALHQRDGNDLEKLVCIAEAQELSDALDSDDASDEILYMTYHRYVSDSWGVDFEIEHGDPELMFGGI